MPLTQSIDPNEQQQQGVVGGPVQRATGAGANTPPPGPGVGGFAPTQGPANAGGAIRAQAAQQANPTNAPWQNTERNLNQQGTSWQPPPQQQQQSQPAQQPPQQQGAPAPAPQSIGQQGLSGSAGTTQNFLSALRQVGAGSNNAFQASPAAQQAQGQPLLGAPAAMGGGPGTVSYNNGLGAGGGNVSFGGQVPGVSLGGSFANPNRLMVPPAQGAGAGPSAGGPSGSSPSPSGPTGLSATPGPAAPLSAGFLGRNNPFSGPNPNDPDAVRDGGGYPSQPRAISAPPPTPSLPTPLSAPTPQQQQLQNGLASTNGPYQFDLSALSDERSKRDVAPAKKKIGSFLDALGAHEYSYKDPAHGKGRFVSPMAQELERTSIGKSAIVEGADGLKRVDYARLAGAQLAASALFHRRLKALEGRR